MLNSFACLMFVVLVTQSENAQSLNSVTDEKLEGHQATALQSGQYFISQSWSQETNYKRLYIVNIPKNSEREVSAGKKRSVLIFLHGNGGNAKGALRGFLRRNKQIAAQYVTVFAQGYLQCWNIVSERSKADDRQFIEAIVKQLAACSNIDANNFTIMGTSNGSALANQLAIETQLPNIRNYITAVSPLNQLQHDGKDFKAKGIDNDYRSMAAPLIGKRLLNISGTNDRLVPYRGGTSQGIPAKVGKLKFVAAEESIFLWAKQMGFEGKKRNGPNKTVGNLEVYSYLDGDVVHIKVKNQGHNATSEVSEQQLLDFMSGSEG